MLDETSEAMCTTIHALRERAAQVAYDGPHEALRKDALKAQRRLKRAMEEIEGALRWRNHEDPPALMVAAYRIHGVIA